MVYYATLCLLYSLEAHKNAEKVLSYILSFYDIIMSEDLESRTNLQLLHCKT